MDRSKAQLLVSQYGEAIATHPTPFKPASALPASKEDIKEAFRLFLDTIIRELRVLPAEIGENLVATYSMLDLFVEDKEAARLNEAMVMARNIEDQENPARREQIKEAMTRFSSSFRNGAYSDELDSYIGECLAKCR